MTETDELLDHQTLRPYRHSVLSSVLLYGGGLLLLCLFVVMYLLSGTLTRDQNLADDPVYTFTAIWLASGGIWFVVCWFLRGWKLLDKKTLLFILGIGLVFRILMLPASVILEDDYYRYLWDGGVTANGHNPYAYPPGAFQQTPPKDHAEALATIETPAELHEEAEKAGPVIEHVNHSHIKTIYPPVAQVAFALAYYVSPYDVVGWRIVILAMELLAVFLALGVLKKLNAPLIWIMIYWWNPIVIKEFANNTHMDIILAPLLFGMVWLGLKHRTIMATVLLMLAVGVKVWPIILLPLLLRSRVSKRLKDWYIIAASLVIVVVMGLLMLWPIHTGGLDETSGFIRYSESWQNNDGLFKIALAVTRWCCSMLGEEAWHAQLHTRRVVAGLIAMASMALAFWPWRERWSASEAVFNESMGAEWIKRLLIISAALFMFSPTAFPWYFLWVMIFLVFRPTWPLMLYVVTLPLYAMQFKMWDQGGKESWEWFQTYVPWIEHGIVWSAILVSLMIYVLKPEKIVIPKDA